MKNVVRIYAIILMGYTAWRTFDFMSSQLPKGDLSFWLAIVFLFATEAGLLLWHELARQHTTTQQQEDIARWMWPTDLVASTAAGVADMILRQTLIDYAIPTMLAQALIYGMPAIVALNVLMALVYQLNDADTQIEREKRQLRFAIYQAALVDLNRERKAIARDKKGIIYQELRDEVTGQVDRRHGSRTKAQPEAKPELPDTISLNSTAAIPQNGQPLIEVVRNVLPNFIHRRPE